MGFASPATGSLRAAGSHNAELRPGYPAPGRPIPWCGRLLRQAVLGADPIEDPADVEQAIDERAVQVEKYRRLFHELPEKETVLPQIRIALSQIFQASVSPKGS